MTDEQLEACRSAFKAIKRFAQHAKERNITVPLWAGLLWDDAIGKVDDALELIEDS